jgi:Family of unknown function (DUF6261)
MITSIELDRMRHAEYIQFSKDCAAIVGANDPAAQNVQPKYDAYINKIAELEVLFKKSTENPITAEIETLDMRRDRAVSGLLMHINALNFHFDPAIATPAQVLQHNLKIYTTNIARENYNAETALINNLVTDWETKPELANALATLGLTNWKDELKTANQLFNDRYIARTQDMATASVDNVKTKRLEGNTAYYELRDHINANMTLAPSPLLVKTTNEINALITQYNQLLVGRAAVSNKQ